MKVKKGIKELESKNGILVGFPPNGDFETICLRKDRMYQYKTYSHPDNPQEWTKELIEDGFVFKNYKDYPRLEEINWYFFSVPIK